MKIFNDVYAIMQYCSRNHPQLKAVQGGLMEILRNYDTYQGNISENVHYKKEIQILKLLRNQIY